MARVLLEGIAKSYGDVEAVQPLDLGVRDRELLTLLGPSGCGKSTVLGLVAGLEAPSAGEITIGERRVTHLPPQERDVAMVFQSYALYPHKSVFENIAFPLRLRRTPREEIPRRVGEIARRLGIDGLLDRRPAQLSGGQRQRVALGRALVRRSSVFLLDEPLSNLDAQLRADTRAEIKRLHGEFETTTLYVTHDQTEALTLSDRIALLKQGQLQQVGTPAEIYARPANRFVAAFVGNPGMNFVPGRLEQGRLLLPGWEVTPASTALAGDAPREILVGFRPEDVELAAAEGARGRIEEVERLGFESLVSLSWDGTRIVARGPADLQARTGETLTFRVPAERLHYFDPRTDQRLRSSR